MIYHVPVFTWSKCPGFCFGWSVNILFIDQHGPKPPKYRFSGFRHWYVGLSNSANIGKSQMFDGVSSFSPCRLPFWGPPVTPKKSKTGNPETGWASNPGKNWASTVPCHFRVYGIANFGASHVVSLLVMWVKQCHKPPIWEWFIPPTSGDLGDDLVLFSLCIIFHKYPLSHPYLMVCSTRVAQIT